MMAFHFLLVWLLTAGLGFSSQLYYQASRQATSSPENYRILCRLVGALNDPGYTAEWLFNGSNYTESPCFAGATSPTSNTLNFNHSSNCDGYIQCGNGTEYSNPLKLLAAPARTPTYRPGQVRITRPEGSSVTLPCNVIVSAIGGLNVRWVSIDLTNQGNPSPVNKPLNDDYSVTLTDLEADGNTRFYRCEVITTNSGIFQGQVFELTVLLYHAPNIISIVPDQDDDENEFEIVLEARGTNLQLSWLLDDVKLNNSISGVEITNNINSNTNGVSRSKLELSKDMLRSITKPIQLTAIASNIDRSNCSDLRGISSSCAMGSQIRNDSVSLWLYPAPRPVVSSTSTEITPTVTTPPPSGSVCDRMINMYKAIFGGVIAFLVIVLLLVMLCCLLFPCRQMICSNINCNDDPEDSPSDNPPSQPATNGHGFDSRSVESVDKFTSKLITFLEHIGDRDDTSKEVKTKIKKMVCTLAVTRLIATDSVDQPPPVVPPEDHQYDIINDYGPLRPAELKHMRTLEGAARGMEVAFNAENPGVTLISITATAANENDYIDNLLEDINIPAIREMLPHTISKCRELKNSLK